MVFNDTNPAGSRSGQETSQKERGALTEDRFDTLTHRLATASMSRRDVIGVITRIRCRREAGNGPER